MNGLKRAFVLGKNRDLFFGLPALQYLFSKVDEFTFSERLAKGNVEVQDIKTLAYFIHASLLGGCERKDESPDFTFPDVYDYVSEIVLLGGGDEVLTQVAHAFSESTALKNLSKTQKKSEVGNERA